jgi:hypothetical protein
MEPPGSVTEQTLGRLTLTQNPADVTNYFSKTRVHLLVEPHHLPVDREGRSNRSLRRVLQRNGRAEQRHDPVPGHLVDRAPEVPDPVDLDLVDRIHEAEGVFRAELLGEWCEPLQVAEHDGDVLPLAFDLVSLSEDLLGQALREVTLDLGEFVVGGEVSGGWFRGCS